MFVYDSHKQQAWLHRGSAETTKRSRLNDERTSDLTLPSHKKELVKAIDIADIIDKFAESNRIVVLN